MRDTLNRFVEHLFQAAKKGTVESSKRIISMGSSFVLWVTLLFFSFVAWYQVCTAPSVDTAIRDIIIAVAASIAVLAGMIGRKDDAGV